MRQGTSRRSVASPPRTLKPFTIDHWRKWASRLILDTGDPWPLEDDPWLLEIVADILKGYSEIWVVAPEGNSKTTFFGGYGLYHLDFTPSPWIPVGAASRDQAEILFGQAAGFVERTDGLDVRQSLNGRFKVFEGYRKITSPWNGGRGLKVYAADKATGDGVIPTLCLIDEPHRHKDLGLYRTWKGKLRKRGAQIVAMSTAGEPGSDFEETRDNIRDQATEREQINECHLRVAGARVVMHEFKVPSIEQAKDLRLVKLANPLSVITEQDLRDKLDSPTLDYGEDWLRLTCNIPARSSKAAVSEADWDGAYTHLEIPEGEPVMVGADFAWVLDTTAIQPLWIESADCRVLGETVVLEPPRDGTMLPVDDVKAAFEQLHARNPIEVVVMDRSKAEDIAQWLSDGLGVTVIVREQGNRWAVEDYENFIEGLRAGWLKHTGSKKLRRHVMNAIARKLPGDKYRFDRPSTTRTKAKQDIRVIDALTASGMVVSAAASLVCGPGGFEW